MPLEEEELALEAASVDFQLHKTASKVLVGHVQCCLGTTLDNQSWYFVRYGPVVDVGDTYQILFFVPSTRIIWRGDKTSRHQRRRNSTSRLQAGWFHRTRLALCGHDESEADGDWWMKGCAIYERVGLNATGSV